MNLFSFCSFKDEGLNDVIINIIIPILFTSVSVLQQYCRNDYWYYYKICKNKENHLR